MRYKLWLKISIFFLFITGLIHSLSFLTGPEGQNETEKTMVGLITTYKMDMGAGFTPTFMNMFNALSSCFSMLYLLGGFTLLYLLRNNIPTTVLKGVVAIHLFFFGVSFVIMLFLTFLPPVILTGLTFILLTVTYITIPKNA